MNKLITVSVFVMLLTGCNLREQPTARSNPDLSIAQSHITPKIKNIESLIVDSNSASETFISDYRDPHVARIAQVVTFFDTELSKLKAEHSKGVVKVDRMILDTQKELKDLGGNNKSAQSKLKSLKQQRVEADKDLSQSLKLISSRKKARINTLNSSYVEILMVDFKTILEKK